MSTEASFSIFVGAAIKSIAVLVAAWAVTFLMRGRSAASRHLVWTASAAALLALPFLSASLPQLRMPGGILLSSASSILPAMFQTTVTANATSEAPGNPSEAKRLQPASANLPPAKQGASALNWRLWIMLLWAAGAAAALARMMAGCIAVWRIRRNAPRFPDRVVYSNVSSEISQSLGIRRQVDILESRAGTMPMTFGFLKPAVFMPTDAAAWSEERRRIVLLHELAHVRRGDVAAHLFARVAFAFYWWNPLVWTAWREFLKERERATDDLVLNAGTRASDYAGHLLEVARTMRSSSATGWAAIAMARNSRTGRSQLEGRLVAILDTGINRKTPGRAGAWVAAAIAIAIVAPLAAVRAQDATPQNAQTIPADVDAYIRAATSQKNHEMLEIAAKAAEQVQKYDTAQALLQSAATIRADVSGEQSMQYAIGLLKLGDLEEKRKDSTSATEFYTKAANILGNKPEAVPALMHLGTSALVKKNYEQAYGYFERTQSADPEHAGRAIMWMAITKRNQGQPEETDALFKNALAIQDPQSLDAADAMSIYAQFLRKQGRPEEAADFDTRAAAVRKAAIQTPNKTALQQAASAFRSQSAYNEATGKYDMPASQASATPRAVAPNGVYTIGGDVSQPQLLKKVEPSYSELARIAQFQGSVGLSIVVGTDGTAQNIQVVKPLGFGLDEKAVEAVSQWQFQPGTKAGQPVPVFANVEVNFRLL